MNRSSAVTCRLTDISSESEKKMVRTYSNDTLRTVGVQCGGKLPPASAVQAMFLYEMQRETEAERLFHGQMFDLARVRDATDEQEIRLVDLEQRVTRLRDAAKNKDIEERLATSKTRTDYLAASVNQLSQSLNDHASAFAALKVQLDAPPLQPTTRLTLHDQTALQAKIEKTYRAVTHAVVEQTRLGALVKEHESQLDTLHGTVKAFSPKLDDMKATCDSNFKQLNESTKLITTTQQNALKASNLATTAIKNASEVLQQCTNLNAALSSMQTKVGSCDNDIGILFDERDVLADSLKQALDRIEKLEGLVRALTLQASPLNASRISSPSSTQLLPVMTNDGHPLNLRVPKGQSLGTQSHQKSQMREWGSGSSDSL